MMLPRALTIANASPLEPAPELACVAPPPADGDAQPEPRRAHPLDELIDRFAPFPLRD